MVVDADSHKFLTARTLPKMVLIHPTIHRETGQLEIAVPSPEAPETRGKTFSVPLAHPTTYLANPDQDPSLDHDYVVWDSPAQDGYTVGSPELHAALSAFLGRNVLLIRKGLTKRTVADVPGVVHSEHLDPVVGFADFYALLLASATSLAELNRRVPTTVVPNDAATLEINRFRANVVVEGLSEPWEEDGWKQLRIGDEPIEVGFRCARCMVSPQSGTHPPFLLLADFPLTETPPSFVVAVSRSGDGDPPQTVARRRHDGPRRATALGSQSLLWHARFASQETRSVLSTQRTRFRARARHGRRADENRPRVFVGGVLRVGDPVTVLESYPRPASGPYIRDEDRTS